MNGANPTTFLPCWYVNYAKPAAQSVMLPIRVDAHDHHNPSLVPTTTSNSLARSTLHVRHPLMLVECKFSVNAALQDARCIHANLTDGTGMPCLHVMHVNCTYYVPQTSPNVSVDWFGQQPRLVCISSSCYGKKLQKFGKNC